MDWREDHLKPSRQQYEEFEEDLSRNPSSKSIESGLKVFLAMLFIMPTTGFLIACAVGMVEAQARELALGILLLGAAALSMFQAHRGLVRRKVRILPKSRIRNETAYVGGKMSELATGRTAVVAGAFFLIVAVVSLVAAIQILIK